MTELKRSDKRRKLKRLWLKISLSVMIVLVLSVGAYAFSIYNDAKTTVNNKIHKKVPSIDTGVAKKKMSEEMRQLIKLYSVFQHKKDYAFFT